MKNNKIFTIICLIIILTLSSSMVLGQVVKETTINYDKTYDTTRYSDNIEIINKLEKYNELNRLVEEENNKEITKIKPELVDIQKSIITNKGAVTNNDGLDNIKNYYINDRIIRIEYDNKNNLTNNYSVSMYVGTSNVTYAIYYHPNSTASKDEIIKRNEVLYYITSANGFINYDTTRFSVQYASFIPANLDYYDTYSVDLKNIFDPGFWDYANVDFTNPDTSSSVTLQAKRDLVTVSHSNSFFTISLIPTFIGGVILDTVFLKIDSEDKNHNQDLLVSVGADEFSSVASDFLPLTIYEEPVSNPPSQISSIGAVTLTGTQTFSNNANNIFSNYNSISMSFPDPGTSSSQTLTATKPFTHDSFTNPSGDIIVYLDAFSNRIEYEIIAKNRAYSETFTMCAINNDGQTCDTFSVTTTETSEPPPPPLEDVTQQDLLNGLVSYYDGSFSGTTAFDVHGTNDGTIYGATTGITGQISTGISFDGSGDYIDNFGLSSINNIQTTMSFWIKGNNTSKTQYIIGFQKSSDSSRYKYALTYYGSSASVFINPFTSKTGNAEIVNFDTRVFNNNWHHISIVYDSGGLTNSDKIKIYIDGVLDVLTYHGTIASSWKLDSEFVIGRDKGALNRDGNFIIDEVGIWNRALSSEEVSTLYDIQKDGFESGSYDFSVLSEPVIPDVVITDTINDILLPFNEEIIIDMNNYFSGFDEVEIIVNPSGSATSVSFGNPFDTQYLSIVLDSSDNVIINSKGLPTSATLRFRAFNEENSIFQDVNIEVTEFGGNPIILNPINNFILDISDNINFCLDNYYNNWDYLELEIIDTETSAIYTIPYNAPSEFVVMDRYSIEFSSNGECNLFLTITSSSVETEVLNSKIFMSNDFGSTTNTFNFQIQDVETLPPILTNPIPDFNIGINDVLPFNFSNYFSGYDSVTLFNIVGEVEFEVDILPFNFFIESTNSLTIDTGEITSDLIFESREIETTYTFRADVTNTVGTSSDTFTITINPDIIQLQPFEDLNLLYWSNLVFPMSNYFTNYNNIIVGFLDSENTNDSIQLSCSFGDCIDQIYESSSIKVELIDTGFIIALSITAKNEPFSEPFLIVAQNDFGLISDDFVVNIIDDITHTIFDSYKNFFSNLFNSIFPPAEELKNSEKLTRVFVTIAIILIGMVLLSYSTGYNQMNLIIGLGVGLSILMIVLFTMIGYIPVWLILVLILGLIAFGVGKVRQGLVGSPQ